MRAVPNRNPATEILDLPSYNKLTLVCDYNEWDSVKVLVYKDRRELLLGLLHALFIGAINDVDKDVDAVKVRLPVFANRLLATKIPGLDLEPVHRLLGDVEAPVDTEESEVWGVLIRQATGVNSENRYFCEQNRDDILSRHDVLRRLLAIRPVAQNRRLATIVKADHRQLKVWVAGRKGRGGVGRGGQLCS